MAQNRAARLALKCTQRANINNMHVNLSWLKVDEKLNRQLGAFNMSIPLTNTSINEFKLLAQSSNTHAYPTLLHTSPTTSNGIPQYYIEPLLLVTLFHSIT